MNDNMQIFNKSLEFLGSSMELLGFFVIDPVLMFFDQSFINVYNPYEDDIHKLEIEKLFTDFKPYKYFMRPFTAGKITTYLLLCQDKSMKIYLTYMYSYESYTLQTLDEERHLNIAYGAYIYLTNEFTYLTMDITLAEFFVETTPNVTIAIFSYDLVHITH